MHGFGERVSMVALSAAIAGSVAACGGDASVFGNSGAGGATSANGGSTSQGGSGGAGAQGGVGGTGGTGGTGTGDGGGGAGIPCDAETYEVTLPSLDMVIMYDRSGSTTQWGPTMKDEVIAFASQPWRDGDRIALNIHPDGQNLCDISNYTPMDLPLTPIPQNAAAVQAELQPLQIVGASPLAPVMQASLQYAVNEKMTAMERVVIAVLLMDTQPNQCDTNQQTFISMANSALGLEVRTFIIALPNQNVAFMDAIAQAGGTGSAIDLSAFGGENQVEEELTMIRRRAVPCAFPIPDPSPAFMGDPNPTLTYTPGDPTGTPEVLMKVANDAACGDDGPGWYEASPERGMLCPASCAIYKQDTAPTLEVVYGCPDD